MSAACGPEPVSLCLGDHALSPSSAVSAGTRNIDMTNAERLMPNDTANPIRVHRRVAFIAASLYGESLVTILISVSPRRP